MVENQGYTRTPGGPPTLKKQGNALSVYFVEWWGHGTV